MAQVNIEVGMKVCLAGDPKCSMTVGIIHEISINEVIAKYATCYYWTPCNSTMPTELKSVDVPIAALIPAS